MPKDHKVNMNPILGLIAIQICKESERTKIKRVHLGNAIDRLCSGNILCDTCHFTYNKSVLLERRIQMSIQKFLLLAHKCKEV